MKNFVGGIKLAASYFTWTLANHVLFFWFSDWASVKKTLNRYAVERGYRIEEMENILMIGDFQFCNEIRETFSPGVGIDELRLFQNAVAIVMVERTDPLRFLSKGGFFPVPLIFVPIWCPRDLAEWISSQYSLQVNWVGSGYASLWSLRNFRSSLIVQ